MIFLTFPNRWKLAHETRANSVLGAFEVMASRLPNGDAALAVRARTCLDWLKVHHVWFRFTVAFVILWARRLASLVLVTAVGFPFFIVEASAVVGIWEWTNPVPTGVDLNDAVRVDGRWFVVGNKGTLFALDSAGKLMFADLPTKSDFTAISYAAGQFVAVSRGIDYATYQRDPAIWTSTNGVDWATHLSSVYGFEGLTYAAGRWVAVGSSNYLVTSTDAFTWTPQFVGSQYALHKVAYGNGLWIAVGEFGTIFSTSDVSSWTHRTSGTNSTLQGVAFANGRWVVVGSAFSGFNAGEILVSDDGVTWRRILATQTRLNDVKVWRGSFVAIGDQDTSLVSSDGLNWRAASTDRQTGFLTLAVDGQDSLLLGRSGQCLSSDNTTFRWAPIFRSTYEDFRGVVCVAGRFVAVSQGYSLGTFTAPIKTSTDGVNWTPWNPPASGALAATAVSSNQQVTVVVGNGGQIFTSQDLMTWSQRTSGTAVTLNGVASGTSIHVAVGAGGVIVTSPDGVVWTRRGSDTTAALRTVTCGSGGFVAAGDNGTILASIDGINWVRRNADTTASLQSSAWIDGVGYLIGSGPMVNGATVVGPNSGLLVSPDTVTWTFRNLGLTYGIDTIANTPLGTMISSGFDGLLLSSYDASTWTQSYLRLDRRLHGIAASPSAIVGVGDSGTSLVYRLVPPPDSNPGYLANLSVLTSINSGESFTVGTVIGGLGTSGTKPLLIRAAGPSLTQLGINAVLPNPQLDVFSGQTVVASNRGWGGAAALSASFAQVGAFAYNSAISEDAAAVYTASVPTPPASYTIQVRDAGAGTGTVLAEIYDATASTSFTVATPRLINGSVLKNVGASLTTGFVISGASPVKVLVRAIGPTLELAPFSVPGALVDPKLELFAGNAKSIATNDNWGGTPALTAAFALVGAFALDPGSKDAALLVNLAPGNYTAQVSPSVGATGVALVEVYEVP